MASARLVRALKDARKCLYERNSARLRPVPGLIPAATGPRSRCLARLGRALREPPSSAATARRRLPSGLQAGFGQAIAHIGAHKIPHKNEESVYINQLCVY